MSKTYDVVINGASVAGCTAAVLFARRGARVALLERRSDPAAHKVLCTHYMQPAGYPVLAELGLIEEMESAGAVRNSARYWTRWGWIDPEARLGAGKLPYGYNMRRETFDPMVRGLAARTPGVDLLLGHTVTDLVRADDRVVGVSGTSGDGAFEIRATLVVGADGKDSTVAKLAEVPTTVTDNGRFSYFAHFKGVSNVGQVARAYYLEPDNAYVMPNEEGVTVISVLPEMSKLDEFKQDLEGAYRRFVRALPDAPDIDNAEQITKIIGTINYPLHSRVPTGPGYALIGDAALTSDPLAAVGCAWAMLSAKWLADSTAAAVLGYGEPAVALGNYADLHHRNLHDHAGLISDYALARPFNDLEAFMFSSAAKDAELAEHFHIFGSRLMSVPDYVSPWAISRSSVVNGETLWGDRENGAAQMIALRGGR